MNASSFLLSSMTLLTGASAWVIVGAFAKPFPTFRTTEALVQVGVGLTVCTLWMLLAVAMGAAVFVRRISRWWLLGVLVAILGSLVVLPWPFRYVAEIEIRHANR